MGMFDDIKREFEKRIEGVKNINELKEIEVFFLGKKGKVQELFKQIKNIPESDRKEFGENVNRLKEYIEKNIEEKEQFILNIQREEKLKKEAIDITAPGLILERGHEHILNKVIEEVKSIFISMGFDVFSGPDIETDYYNFEALNIPEHHPARDMQDTFYLAEKILLRTQTSPMQVRTMEKQKPPIRMIAIGRCYRRDALDSSHSPQFHQIEGLVVDKNISFANLKATLSEFSKRMFGESTKVRFTPSYFPFVEPGAETSITCVICGGKGCPVCKYTGYLEMGGSGMVHPNVLKNVGIDPEEYQGFAFGWGIERIAMVKYGIPDIRYFLQNDMRFLKQF
ncbi:phenylalanine--tRNA ligase subunit alpha [Caldisericum exile]|uniref:phenylalanine--tRNA ligase subunit alpha n=1 Tax=Caldisericum exile TaxID=693075 RepID=UPI003C72C516